MSDTSTPTATFLNEDEILTDILLYQMSEHEKSKVSGVHPSHLEKMCAFIEPSIIRLYRLDDVNNPYVDQTIGAANRPSVVSARIIKRIWSKLTGKHVPLS